MLFFVRTTLGLGNATIYARLKNTLGQYWDFVAHTWGIFNSDCRIWLSEHVDGDPYESLYMAEAVVPAGGPWIEEAVDNTDGTVIAFDNEVMGELTSVPTVESTWQEKLEFIYQYLALKRTATSSLETMFRVDNATVLGTSTLNDDGTEFSKNKIS